MSFASALAATLGVEKGYSNNPLDRGGETYAGISRRFHPTWSGWKIIDAMHAANGFLLHLPKSEPLAQAVADFYKTEFWDKLSADFFPTDLGEELFDTAVNSGISTAIRFLQQTLNVLNRNGSAWGDIAEDGKIGPATRAAFTAALSADKDSALFLTVYRIYRGAFYLEIMRTDKTQEAFCRGWIRRLSLTAKSR